MESELVKGFNDAQSRLVVQMSDLPLGTLADMVDTNALKQMVTLDAMSGIVTRAAFEDPSIRIQFSEQHIKVLARFSETPGTFSAAGFSPRGSNIQASDIAAGFKAYGIEGSWQKLTKIARAVGAGTLSLESDYTGLNKIRNSAAHASSYNIPTIDLISFLRNCITSAVAVDVLAMACREAYVTATTKADLDNRISSLSHNYRFVDLLSDGSFAERGKTGRSLKNHSLEADAIKSATSRTGAKAIVVRDTQNLPIRLVWAI